MPDNDVTCISIDESGNKWIGTDRGGLVKFDGTDWTVYNAILSGLPGNSISCIAIDDSDNKWIGTPKGLVKFDGTEWTVYNESNSDLPSNSIQGITVDAFGNKWIGTWKNGLAVFNEGGVVSVEDNNSDQNTLPKDYVLSQNYPNPFNPSTTIKYEIPGQARNDNVHVTLKVYDILGREVAVLVNEQQRPGSYTVRFDASSLSSGVYLYKLTAGNKISTKKLMLLK